VPVAVSDLPCNLRVPVAVCDLRVPVAVSDLPCNLRVSDLPCNLRVPVAVYDLRVPVVVSDLRVLWQCLIYRASLRHKSRQ